MGLITYTQRYRCNESCEESGCPSHEAALEFNSVANIYCFDDGQGNKIWLDTSLAKTLIGLFREYSETRGDTVRV